MKTKKTLYRDMIRRMIRRAESDGEALLRFQIAALKLPTPLQEYKFMPDRDYRFDFAYPNEKIGIEVEGGTLGMQGRHTRGKGYAEDCLKYNLAVLNGWKILRFTTAQVNSGEAVDFIQCLYYRTPYVKRKF